MVCHMRLIGVGEYLAPFLEKNTLEIRKTNNLRVKRAFSVKLIPWKKHSAKSSQIENLIRDFCVGCTINQKFGERHSYLMY